jgi:hypothetical protein
MYQDAIAAAFLRRKEKRGPKVICGQYSITAGRDGQADVCGRPRMFSDGTAVYSYGEHFPIALYTFPERDDSPIMLNTERYQTGAWPVSGKPKFSPTTDKHIRAVADALENAGYQMTGKSATIRGMVFAELAR